MSRLELKGYSIDDITKGLGAFAIGAYVLGYLVLSYHLSSFGFNSISPFRPRVLETGVCTLALFAMPILIGTAVASISSRGVPYSFSLLMRILFLPILCALISTTPGFFGELPNSIQLHWNSITHRIAITIILCLVPFGLMGAFWVLKRALEWIWHHYHTKKLLSALILFPVSVCFVAMGVNSTNTIAQQRIFFWLMLGSSITCIFVGADGEKADHDWRAQQIAKAERQRKELNQILFEINGEVEEEFIFDQQKQLEVRVKTLKDQLEKAISELRSDTSTLALRSFVYRYGPLMPVAGCVMAVAFYSQWVFPYIPVKLGGGEIVAVTLYQTEANQSSRVIHGGLLDESDQGFFILLAGQDKDLFIPKERVDAIYFGNGQPDINHNAK